MNWKVVGLARTRLRPYLLSSSDDKLEDLQKVVEKIPGTQTAEDSNPVQRQALRDFLATREPVLSRKSQHRLIACADTNVLVHL